MCPDPQILSFYMDGELPSPWKEKMENHLTECSECRGKLDNFRQLQELLKKDTLQELAAVEREEGPVLMEAEFMEAAKERVWRKLESKPRFRSPVRISSSYTMWKRRLSIPMPAAAAAVVIALVSILLFRGGSASQNELKTDYANQISRPITAENTNFSFAAEEEIPSIMPTMDINSVLQYLSDEGANIIILHLPESRDFSMSGEPKIIRAADYNIRR
ncbi:MAG: hypothetical protein LBQ89_06420 [Treponema sp.]|jgi:negative regulator of sigma E activity|nr:hypothetical protein [Treponema sp.]